MGCSNCDCECRGKRGKRGHRGHRGPTGPTGSASSFALKWSGLVNEAASVVTANLADAGTGTPTPLAPVENNYPLCRAHTAVCIGIRSRVNSLTNGAVVNLLRNNAVVATFPAPASGITTVNPLPNIFFDEGNIIEVQVVVAPGSAEGNSVSLTAVVEFI